MKIAIVGSGISGLGAAYMLGPQHDVTLYEKEDRLGGHSRTMEVHAPERGYHHVAVDTGFIVFNKRNYPLLTALFDHLEVPIAKSDMSFGVSIDQGWLEYGTRSATGLFAQYRNLFRPAYWSMLKEITRFNQLAPRYVDADLSVSLGDLLHELELGTWFQNYYLLPMGASIWSTPLDKMLAYPAKTFVRFFMNHGLLTIADHPQWYTVQGGSKVYVDKIRERFTGRIKYASPVVRVERNEKGVKIYDEQGGGELYDQVILACHADQSLAMLANPTSEESNLLKAFKYQDNDMVLHADTRFMPRRQRAWSSWVYQHQLPSGVRGGDVDKDGQDGVCAGEGVSLSYWMNNLQPLRTQETLLVTLNPHQEPDPNLIFDRKQFAHPLFDRQAIDAQSQLHLIQGKDRIWYCGAYQRYGFHEDGLWSARIVASELGLEPAWLP